MKDTEEARKVKRAVERQLAHFLSQQEAVATGLGPEYGALLAAISELVGRGGKRVRPLLMVWSYAGFGGKHEDQIIKAAAALELFHTGILMHDDIIDRDLTRWGGQNISGRYMDYFQSDASFTKPRARHLADSYALMAGDGCIDMSYQQFLASGFEATDIMAGLQLMHHTFFVMLGGEFLDVTVSLKPLERLETEELLAICDYKTAAYSFAMPLELGSILAGASVATRDLIRELGSHLGIAYQLQDDLLGIFGDSEKTGKPVLSDLREGKRTLLMRIAYNGADKTGQKLIDSWLGNAEADMTALAQIQMLLRGSGAVDQVESLIHKHHTQAIKLATRIGWQQPYAAQLIELFQCLVGREA